MTADLSRLADVTARRARMAEDLAWADEEWRRLIVAAIELGDRVTDIAKAAGVTRARVYQIRDGRR